MQSPGVQATAERAELVRLVRHASRRLALRTSAYVQLVARRVGLSPADVHAVGALKEAAESGTPISAGELGRLLALSPAATTALLGRMERAGHAERRRSGSDARRVSVTTTPHAAAMSVDEFATLVDAYERTLHGYTDDELRLVVQVLDDLVQATGEAARRGPAR